MGEIIKWMNCNDGFLMAVITFVYVIATIFISIFNGKSAKASRAQIVEAQKQQKQNAGLQLYTLRKAVMEKIILRQVYQVYVDMSLLFPTDLFNEYKSIIEKQDLLKEVQQEVKSFEADLNDHEFTVSLATNRNDVAQLQTQISEAKKANNYEILKQHIFDLIALRKPKKDITEQYIDQYISLISKEKELDAQITKEIAVLFAKMQSYVEKSIKQQ